LKGSTSIYNRGKSERGSEKRTRPYRTLKQGEKFLACLITYASELPCGSHGLRLLILNRAAEIAKASAAAKTDQGYHKYESMI
jgi:hypothetical protein